MNEEVLRYRGHGVVESAGMRKGLIAELGPAAKAVRAASEQAERVARVNIDECVVGVGGPHIRGLNTRGGIQLGRGMREITHEDVRAAVDHARAIERPADREILHLLPRQFILDEQPGIFDPVGMVGARLEVDLHIATCSGSALQSTVTCANRAGLEVSEAVLEPLAARRVHAFGRRARAGRLPARHRRALQRTGGFFRGRGGLYRVGSHRRSALYQRPRHRPANAGCAGRGAQAAIWQRGGDRGAATGRDRDCQPAGRRGRLSLRTMAEILEPRARELMHYVRESLRHGGVVDALGAGCVLTGGGAMLPGMLDVTESQLRVPARTGLPVRLSQMPAELNHPAWAAAIGMVLYAHRTQHDARRRGQHSLRARLRAMFAASF